MSSVRFPTDLAEDFWARVEQHDPEQCWPWTAATAKDTGYGVVWAQDHTENAHRVAYALTHGDPGEALVLHSCDNPPCCNPFHLFTGTHADNSADMVAKDRVRHGERHPRTKLTDAQVLAIRGARAAGRPLKALAAEYGISQAHVSEIASGKTRRRAGSVRYSDYFKAQWWDTRSVTWRDVQRAHDTEDACRAAFDPTIAVRWRVMQVTADRGRFPLAETLLDPPTTN